MGARFSASLTAAAPFQIQLQAPASGRLQLLEVQIFGDSSSGSASVPVVTRPSSAGTGTGTALPLDGTGTAGAIVVTSFSAAPALPVVSTYSGNLPYNRRRRFKLGELSVEAGEALLIYAAASGGHTLSGHVIWEES